MHVCHKAARKTEIFDLYSNSSLASLQYCIIVCYNNLLSHSLTFPGCKISQKGSLLLVICAHYIINYFAQTVSAQDLPEQIRGAADHSGVLSESLHTMLAADISDANPYFLEHWNGSQTCGEDKYKEGESHHPLISALFLYLYVITGDTDPLLRMDCILSFFAARMHLRLSIYLYDQQHSR